MTDTHSAAIAEVVAAVRTSRRYQWVSPTVVARLAAEEVPKSRNAADAQKRTKRRLHQIFGAYAQPLPYASIAQRLNDALTRGDRTELMDVCRWALGQHASTRERLPIVEAFYAEIFRVTGTPTLLLDIACGLNPLAVPWMGLAPGSTYFACDIDIQLEGVLDNFLTGLGIDHQVEVIDALMPFEAPAADVALLLKTVPCLDQQRAGAGLNLIDRLNANWLVVSYPTRSLGGHSKGMARTYRAQFEVMHEQRRWRVHERELPGELVFIIDTRA